MHCVQWVLSCTGPVMLGFLLAVLLCAACPIPLRTSLLCFHTSSCIDASREATFISHSAPQTQRNVLKGRYNHKRNFFSCGPEIKPQLPVVLLQVQQLPGRRLHQNIGLAPQPPRSSFLGTSCQDSFSVAPSPVLDTLVPCLPLLQKFQSQPCPSQSVLMQQWLSVSGLGESSGCSFSLVWNPRGTLSNAPSDTAGCC